MADFKKIQQDINKARAAKDAGAKDLLEAKEQLRSVEKQLSKAARVTNGNDGNHVSALQRKKEGLQRKINELDTSVRSNKNRAFELLGTLVQLEDPTKQVEQLSDAYPFLLFPLRIETRFKKVVANGVVQNQLWVRIFPDDCQVEVKEDMLSESEISGAKSFWEEMWQAGGIEEEERGAWRTLVNNFGSGRPPK